MSRAVTPELALAYLRELSCDVRGVRVRDPEGRVLAGEAVLDGRVERASADGVEVAVALGPHGLPALARHDAAIVATALGAEGGRA